MFKLQYFITAFLISVGVFTLFNYDIPLMQWANGSKIGTVVVALIIYHNTVSKHDQNSNGSI